MNKYVFFALSALLAIWSAADLYAAPSMRCQMYPGDNYENGKPYVTPLGKLELYRCQVEGGENSVGRVVLGGRDLFKDSSLWMTDKNKAGTIFLYGGGVGRESLLGGCTGVQYLLDLRGHKPRLVAFGIQNACNQVNDVKWEKDRVVVNFNRDARFFYSFKSGKMELPKDIPERYDPIFDENSPVIKEYERSSHPHQKYQLAPPYAKEIRLDW